MIPAAVLLDLDGTLILSEHIHRRVWQRFFDEWRLEVDDRDYARSYQGRRAADVLGQVRGPWRPEDVPGALAALHAHTDAEAGNVEVVPGAVELVEELHRRGRLMAVVTSATRTWTRRVLDDVLGIGGKIPVVVTAEEVETGNPTRRATCARAGAWASIPRPAPRWRTPKRGCRRSSRRASGPWSG